VSREITIVCLKNNKDNQRVQFTGCVSRKGEKGRDGGKERRAETRSSSLSRGRVYLD